MTTQWTKFSEQLPEESVLHVHVLWPNKEHKLFNRPPGGWDMFTRTDAMWHPVTYPELPKEPTQLDRDNEAMLDAWRSQGIDFAHGGFGDISYAYQEGWKMALAYERAEMKKLVDICTVPCSADSGKISNAIKELRKRCGLDK